MRHWGPSGQGSAASLPRLTERHHMSLRETLAGGGDPVSWPPARLSPGGALQP